MLSSTTCFNNFNIYSSYEQYNYLHKHSECRYTTAYHSSYEFFYSSYRIFTFGIGHGCSTELVRDIAKASNGKPTFVKDNDRLQSKVVYLQLFRQHPSSYILVR